MSARAPDAGAGMAAGRRPSAARRIRQVIIAAGQCLLVACGSAPATPDAMIAVMQTERPPRPINIAHRGASAYAPEHTLAAYRLALEMGADYVEQDLQLTRDGVLVCLHDTTLERTTNVEQVFPDRFVEVENESAGARRKIWRVADFTLAEIKQLDAGSWFGAAFTGERVPTFQEALDLVKGRAGIYPETKAPDEYEALGFSMEEQLLRVLAANGLDTADGRMRTPVFIQSFSAASLRRLRTLAGATYPLVQLIGAAEKGLLTDEGLRAVTKYAAGIGPALPLVIEDPSRVAAARRLGLGVHPYTVRAATLPARFPDATTYMRHVFEELGATGVFTDHPDLFPRDATTGRRPHGSGSSSAG